MHVFTSITANYIPKARVLATSVKRHNPDAHFTLVLSDAVPPDIDPSAEPFDLVLLAADLGIPKFQSWAFKHSVVEMCTGVKGYAFGYLARKLGADKIVFLDPDIVVFSSLSTLSHRLDRHSVLLTPHQTEPESDARAIVDNEICSLKHGVFNLGFLAVRSSNEGLRFIDWWTSRLYDYCYDDIPGGLFTDQRWIDLAPCLFKDVEIIRNPGLNVATWNLTSRVVSGPMTNLKVNGEPLIFYHFSGFDSGAQEKMLDVYGGASPVLRELRNWYCEECERNGQTTLGSLPSRYHFYSDGQVIELKHRLVYRWRKDLADLFPDPFNTQPAARSYLDWFIENESRVMDNWAHANPGHPVAVQFLSTKLRRLSTELDGIYGSRSFRAAEVISRTTRLIRQRLSASNADEA